MDLTVRTTLLLSALTVTLGCGHDAEPTPYLSVTTARKVPAKIAVDLKIVKYDQLVTAIKAQRGSVVVVDIWGEFCVPCKQEFPHLVQMHRKYGPKALVCIPVSIDQPKDHDKARTFLQQVGATFQNFLLDEDSAVWQERWDLTGVPAAFVFDRDGRRTAKFDNDDPDKQYRYADVEAFVDKLLRSP